MMFALRYIKIRQVAEMKYQIRKHSIHHTLFKKNLLITNSLTSGLCMVVGDLVEQEFEYQSQMLAFRYDWGRIFRMCIVGIAVGPLHHFYYIYLDKFIPKVNLKTVLIKVFCDQTIASPLSLFAFYGLLGTLERKTFQDCKIELEKKLLYTYMGDCIYWPPIQFVNFYFLPTHYRVLYINVATIAFNVFLSFMKHFDQYEP